MLPALVVALSSTLAGATAPPWAIINARILVAPGKTIAQGAIVLRDGLIQAVGEAVPIPPDTLIYDAKGLTVCAGWIDGATYFGFPRPVRNLTLAGNAPAERSLQPGAAQVPEDINSPERYLSPTPAGVFAPAPLPPMTADAAA